FWVRSETRWRTRCRDMFKCICEERKSPQFQIESIIPMNNHSCQCSGVYARKTPRNEQQTIIEYGGKPDTPDGGPRPRGRWRPGSSLRIDERPGRSGRLAG